MEASDPEQMVEDLPGVPPTLPNEIVLEILRFLPLESLLQARRVCSRWRDLVLHPDVWRSRCIWDHGNWKVAFRAAIKLAPCINHMSLRSKTLSQVGFLATTTKCAVQSLKLDINWRLDGEIAALIVRNQAALGRLRRLTLWLFDTGDGYVVGRGILVLLAAVFSTPGLVMLDLDCPTLRGLPLDPLPLKYLDVPEAPVNASLRMFRGVCWLPDAYLQLVLETHAGTLEKLDLSMSLPPLTQVPVAALLATMPRLRALRCGILKNMSLVQQCSITDLVLDLHEARQDPVVFQELKTFLREATGLKRVGLYFQRDEDELLELMSDLVGALAASKRSEVEQLTLFVLDNHPPITAFAPPALGAALSGLPHLERARMKCLLPCDGFLRNIHCPNLRWLELAGAPHCVHEWMHRTAVLRTLYRNPSLHLRVGASTWCADCGICSMDCHETPQSKKISGVLTGHLAGECGVEHESNFFELV